MISESDIQAVLEADTGVGGIATLLTGGIYTRDGLGVNGITPGKPTAAWSGPVLLPCALVVERTDTPDNQISDGGAKIRSTRQPFDIFLYDSGNADKTTLKAADERLVALLEFTKVNNSPLIYGGTVWSREQALNNAHLGRATFAAHRVKG